MKRDRLLVFCFVILAVPDVDRINLVISFYYAVHIDGLVRAREEINLRGLGASVQVDYSQAPVSLYVIGYTDNFIQNHIRDMV